TCADALAHFQDTKDAAHANVVAWTCALAPAAVTSYEPALALARRAVAAEPKDRNHLSTLAAMLYRAGRHQDAVEKLKASLALHGKDGDGFDRLFLAMAHHRLSHAEEARPWLGQAKPGTGA